MVEIQRLTSTSKLSEPKRYLKYILLWCKKGKIEIIIDGHTFNLSACQTITLTSGQYHQIKQIDGDVIALYFTLDFFCNTDNDIELIFHNGLFCHFGMNEVITIKNESIFNSLLDKIENEIINKPYQYLISIHSYIELLLVETNRSKIENGDEIWKPDALFLKFLEQIRNNFENNYAVSELAERLNTNQAKLNELSKLYTGKTAQNVIYSLIISEAKRLLYYSNLSIKEISFKLGFYDPFYFSNFFKKHTSKSPLDYKKELVQ
jgi:AraC family transcriptional regulator, transcriptional activator of pobA